MPTTSHVIIQSMVAFFFLLILARIMGKRQLAQLNFFDYIAGITIGNIAGSWSLDDVKDIHAIASLLIWAILSIFMSWLQKNFYFLRMLLDGRPLTLVADGQVQEDTLKHAHMSSEELMLLLRNKDIFKLSDVESAVLETNGALSVMKKRELQPVTPQDLQLATTPEHLPVVAIIDGRVMESALQKTGYSSSWLLGEVMKQGAKGGFEDVFIAQIDTAGNVYVDLFADTNLEPQVKPKPLLAANLKKAQADLEGFALATDNPDAKSQYEETAKALSDIFAKVGPFLKE